MCATAVVAAVALAAAVAVAEAHSLPSVLATAVGVVIPLSYGVVQLGGARVIVAVAVLCTVPLIPSEAVTLADGVVKSID